jgi:group I intron endonuclease
MSNIIKSYDNLDTQKLEILNDLKYKAGIYQLVNKTNGKTYIGSSIDLRLRFYSYFNFSHISRTDRGNSLIHKALLKYGYSNFSLTILEFVDLNGFTSRSKVFKSILLEREQYHLDTKKPEYNILEVAGSSLGFRLSDKTRLKMSEAKKGLSSHRKGKTHTEESKLLMKKNNGMNKVIYMFSSDGTLLCEFPSVANAAETTGISRFRISRACASQKVVDHKYIFSFSSSL